MPTDLSADHNLLFGVLALQMDFITRDDLIRAMQAWVLEKSKRIGKILVEQGTLSSDENELLESLLKKHLERHSNNPERSLAALPCTGVVREDLQQIADEQFQTN